MDFGYAIEQLKQGKKLKRKGWNGNGIFLELQRPDIHSKMTHEYIFINTLMLDSKNEYAKKNRVPWVASQTDMLSNDWEVIK